ncbi:MAG: hypothetical protein KDB61_09730, partial [Planctomycetes bacterium]|nr:hypothetical protein [Planctomycetota bacterium]
MKGKLANMRHWISTLVLALLVGSAPATAAPIQDGHNHGAEEIHATDAQKRSFEYSPEVLQAWAKIPIQEGGRIKPLDTFAGFQLLRFNGKRGINVKGLAPEEKLTPVAWLLDCIFFPEQARDYPCMIVNLKDVAVAVGLNLDSKKKRDRYSYNELVAVRSALMNKANEANGKDPKTRNAVDRQLLTLSRNFLELEDLFRVTRFGDFPLPTSDIPALAGLFTGGDPELPQFLGRSAEIKMAAGGEGGTANPTDGAKWTNLFGYLSELQFRNYSGLAIFPPTATPELQPEWLAWPEMIQSCLAGDKDALDNVPALEALAAAYHSRQDGSAFTPAAVAFAGMVRDRAVQRGEYER